MKSSWRTEFVEFILRLSYAYSLMIGLFPAPAINWSPFDFKRKTKLYLSYSAIVHMMSFIGIATYCPCRVDDNDIVMQQRPVLKWVIVVSGFVKIVAICVIIIEVWLQRKRIVKVFYAFKAYVRRYEEFQCTANNNNNNNSSGGMAGTHLAMERLKAHIEILLISKFLSAVINMLLHGFIALSMIPTFEAEFFIYFCTDFVLSTFIVATMWYFFYVMCLLHRQFELINIALSALRQQLHSFIRLRQSMRHAHSHRIPKSHSILFVKHKLVARVGMLMAMHFDGYRLAQRIFRLSERITAAVLLKIFFANIQAIYQSILVVFGCFAGDAGTAGVSGFLVVICFYLDAILIMHAIDSVLASYNNAAQILRQLSSLDVQLNDAVCLVRKLEHFASHLRIHKLEYKICGFFRFDKESSLNYFLSALVHVSVVEQFDIKHK